MRLHVLLFASLAILAASRVALAQDGAVRMPVSPLDGPRPDVEEMVADLRDEETVTRLLARTFSVEDAYRDADLQAALAGESAELLHAAERRVARADARLAVATAQVESGRIPAEVLRPISLDAQARLDLYQIALMQSRLIEDVLDGARASTRLRGRSLRRGGAIERFAGSGVFRPAELGVIEVAYARRFQHQLPVSALGGTALHRTLGLDHAGKVDVALNPDQPEGVWLRDYLQHRGIPYYAFRTAILGSATAPHIHIGPGSRRVGSRPGVHAVRAD